MVTRWIDSVPAWALGPRASNPKFGGGIILAGISNVSDRLEAIVQLSQKLGLGDDERLRSSGHILHEVRTEIPEYMQFNAPTAISFEVLKAGIASGKYPHWVAMTAPQFGFKGAERGGMISKNPADRKMARALHVEAMKRSLELKDLGLGAGINIWWPAWTSRKVDDPANPPMAYTEAWETMLEFWADVLAENDGSMWLEWKPGDPGIDYLMVIEDAIRFCNAVNNEIGRDGMLINNEFAHVLLSGISVAEGVQATVDACLFHQFVHANSGQMLPMRIIDMLVSGVAPEEILIGTDWDWAVGMGGKKNWDDQKKAIDIMDQSGQEVIYCEHDVNPSGLDPLTVFELSIRNRHQMLMECRTERQID